jgi:hypothetical protein
MIPFNYGSGDLKLVRAAKVRRIFLIFPAAAGVSDSRRFMNRGLHFGYLPDFSCNNTMPQ